MKQYRIIAAYNAAEKLSELTITEKEQWAIYQLRKFLRPHKEFQDEREQEIKNKYIEFADENGNVTGRKRDELLEELETVSNLDIELEEREKPSINLTNGITCKIMEALEDFIEFIPPDK